MREAGGGGGGRGWAKYSTKKKKDSTNLQTNIMDVVNSFCGLIMDLFYVYNKDVLHGYTP